MLWLKLYYVVFILFSISMDVLNIREQRYELFVLQGKKKAVLFQDDFFLA